MINKEIQKLLRRVSEKLTENHGDLVKKIILFGSRVEGGAGPYSDYDVLIILSADVDWRLKDGIIDSIADINLEEDILIDAHIISENELSTIKGKQPYIQNALLTGIVA
jgi:predicted nucleotidyltransferase